jgi:1-acyl-sn-glycerol-3-phosphate acyltransferase
MKKARSVAKTVPGPKKGERTRPRATARPAPRDLRLASPERASAVPVGSPGLDDSTEAQSALSRLLELAERAADGFDAFAPDFLRELDEEVGRKIAAAPMDLNGFGYDPWGFHTDVARRALLVCALLYRYYFRCETHGIENMPEGRVLVIGNHAGQIALDAAMIGTATLLEGEPPRILRGMGEYWLPTLPLINVLMVRVGSVVGTPKNCIDLLHHGEAVIAFPEGVRGMNKSFTERYQLQEFGFGFMRLALQTNTPIVPVAVVGSEEQAPSLGSVKSLARLLGMPAFPLVLTPLPLPVKYRIYFGEPMEFRGNPNDEDEVIAVKVEKVKDRIRGMLEAGLRRRRSVFF